MSKEKHLRRREADPVDLEAAKVRFLETVRRALELTPIAPDIFVETGTLYGDRTQMACEVFKSVWTIELSDEFYRRACERFIGHPNVNCLHGNSAQVLERFIHGILPIFFLLDAHPCRLGVDPKDRGYVAKGAFPLWGELKSISQRRDVTDIICVDDRHNHNRSAGWLLSHNKPSFWIDVTDDAIQATIVGRKILVSQRINNGFVMVVK